MGFLDRIRNMGAPSTPAEADDLVIRQLSGRGADLTRPRHVLHFLDFDDKANASAAADEIQMAGYETTLTAPNETTPQWSLRAEAYRVVDRTTVDAYRAWFERVASEHSGEYDGWEAAAKP